jgi:putative FmdB family regulatory protein
MPNYDYRCKNCKKSFVKFFSYDEYGKKPVACPHCESDLVQRKIGRIRIAHAAGARLENMADPDNLDALEDNPRALGQMMRQMSEETGEDMGPEFDEVVHRLESGQSPEQIESDLPDLLGEDAGPSGSDFGDDDF